MPAVVKLAYFYGMATATCAGCNQYRDVYICTHERFMLGGHRRIGFYLVAVKTGDTSVGVAAIAPIIENAWLFDLVAVDTFLRNFGIALLRGAGSEVFVWKVDLEQNIYDE